MKKLIITTIFSLITLIIIGCANPSANTGNLVSQEKCAKQANEAFTSLGYKYGDDMNSYYENHFNQKLNKCFIEIITTSTAINTEKIQRKKFILDAYENKAYADFDGYSTGIEPPYLCDVNGIKCNSETEFDELVKIYMEN